MRILHIDTGSEMRGGQRQVVLLLRRLEEAGHAQVLLARAGAPLRRAAEAAGARVRDASLSELWRLCTEFDLVHAHDAHGHTLAALGCRKPFVVSRRVAFPIRRSIGSRWKYRRPARFIAVSRFVGRQLEAGGVNGERIDIVYDGVESGPDGADWSADYPAVTLASEDPLKGRDLARAAAAAAGIELVCSGDLQQDLEHASMFVYITRSEGLGSAALLAMRMGVPVIASRTGGLPEIFADGRSGILVDNDPGEIAEAMRRVRGDAARARDLIGFAKRRIEECFTAEHMTRGTAASYARALAG